MTTTVQVLSLDDAPPAKVRVTYHWHTYLLTVPQVQRSSLLEHLHKTCGNELKDDEGIISLALHATEVNQSALCKLLAALQDNTIPVFGDGIITECPRTWAELMQAAQWLGVRSVEEQLMQQARRCLSTLKPKAKAALIYRLSLPLSVVAQDASI